jgi:hypothetical protein
VVIENDTCAPNTRIHRVVDQFGPSGDDRAAVLNYSKGALVPFEQGAVGDEYV